MAAIDHLEAETFSALGASPLVWIDLTEAGAAARAATLAAIDAWPFDLLLTAHPAAPARGSPRAIRLRRRARSRRR